jgi:hypothetical protein
VSRQLIFYFPFRSTGGVSVLFLRLARLLRDRYDVFLADYADGYMGQRVPDGVTLLDVETTTDYPRGAVLVVQSLRPWNLGAADRLPAETRVLFWNLHPYNLYPYIFSDFAAHPVKRLVGRLLKPLSLVRKARLRRVVEYLSARRALVFMDRENYVRTCAFFPRTAIAERYLPVLSDEPAEAHAPSLPGATLRCGWLGRLVDFKAHILAHLMTRLDAAIPVVGPIEMSIIGDGEAAPVLKRHAQTLPRLRVRFMSDVPLEELGTCLADNVDVLFAMGSSALEGASRRIPTILLDYSYQPIEGVYHFRAIEETAGYGLGELIGPHHLEPASSLETLLADIRTRYAVRGQRAYEYWRRTHAPSVVAAEFANALTETSATVGELRDCGYFSPDVISRAVLGSWNRIRGTAPSPGFGNL